MGERPWRFRSSGIAMSEFLSAAPKVEPLDPEVVRTSERRSRKSQLLKSFEGSRFPLIDIFIKEEDHELPFLRSALTPGSWYWIGVRKRRAPDDRLPVFLGAPEFGADPLSPRALQFLEAVPPFFEYRLRDIFSLAHILDAGEEEGFGGEGAPPPDKPDDSDEYTIEPPARSLTVRVVTFFPEKADSRISNTQGHCRPGPRPDCRVAPLAGISRILGVRIFDVGQGDSIAVLGGVNGQVKPVVQVDYGGRQGNPFTGSADIDRRMPVAAGQLLMLSHWDEDHWCTANKVPSPRQRNGWCRAR
jgi:hypothetical protein